MTLLRLERRCGDIFLGIGIERAFGALKGGGGIIREVQTGFLSEFPWSEVARSHSTSRDLEKASKSFVRGDSYAHAALESPPLLPTDGAAS